MIDFIARLCLVLGFALLSFSIDGHALAQADDSVRAVRIGVTSPTKTRLVFDLSAEPTFYIGATRRDQGVVTITLENIGVLADDALPRRARGHIARVSAQPAGQKARDNGFVFSVPLAKTAKVVDAFVIEPSSAKPYHRLVVDLETGTLNALTKSVNRWAAAPAKTGKKQSARKPSVDEKPQNISDVIAAAIDQPEQNTKKSGKKRSSIDDAINEAAQRPKKIIVIDPGHGGTDPGAIGRNGVHEKAVTLAAAKELKKALEAYGGFSVVLTRDKDKRFALAERHKFARRAKADLFISLHADALANKTVRGASVYTLSQEGVDRSAAAALAEGNYIVANTNIGEEDPDVGGILIDLAQRQTGNQSDRLARLLVAKLGGVTPLLNNTHRKGNLNVLLAPDVPAVLLEMGFMSNSEDYENLKSPAWRKRTMKAVARAIEAYFRDDKAGVRHAKNTALPKN